MWACSCDKSESEFGIEYIWRSRERKVKQLHYTMGASVSMFYMSTCAQVVALSERNKLDKHKAHK